MLDILVKLQDGSMVDIEMQVRPTPNFRSSVLYYWARTYMRPLRRGDKYAKLVPTTVIVITNYLELETGFLHSEYHVLEKTDGSRLSEDFELHFLELPWIKDPVVLAAALPELRRWARFWGTTSDDERAEVAKEDPMIGQAMGALTSLSADEETRRAAIRREQDQMLHEMQINSAMERGIEQGIERGRKQGKEEGIEQGIERGIEQGRVQSLADTVVRVLASKGADVTQQLRDIISGCKDAAQLDRWLGHALALNAGDEFVAD